VKRLVVMALALVSCAPLLGAVQKTASTLGQSGQALTLTNLDATPLNRAVVAVDGPAGVTGAVCSTPVDRLSYCRLGDVPPGASVTLKYTGVLRAANASWKTPDGRLQGTVWP